MSELISGKEALIALANGEEVECKNKDLLDWGVISDDAPIILFTTEKNRNGFFFEFRLKPRTITINGVEVPAPFEPKDGDFIFILSGSNTFGYKGFKYIDSFTPLIGAWRTEEEIKQVVAALRSVFNEKTKEGDPS